MDAGTLKYGEGRPGTTGYQRVGLTEVDGIGISTVWLGMDHGWRGGPRVIIETMVFVGDMDKASDQPLDRACRRCTALREAKSSHRQVVRLVRPFQRQPLHLAKPHQARNGTGDEQDHHGGLFSAGFPLGPHAGQDCLHTASTYGASTWRPRPPTSPPSAGHHRPLSRHAPLDGAAAPGRRRGDRVPAALRRQRPDRHPEPLPAGLADEPARRRHPGGATRPAAPWCRHTARSGSTPALEADRPREPAHHAGRHRTRQRRNLHPPRGMFPGYAVRPRCCTSPDSTRNAPTTGSRGALRQDGSQYRSEEMSWGSC